MDSVASPVQLSGAALLPLAARVFGESPRTLAAECPLVFGPEAPGAAIGLHFDGELRSGLGYLVRDVRLGADGARIRVGLIGSVCTDAGHRGRGAATRVLETAAEVLRDAGCSLAMLWADDASYYEARGFTPIGSESIVPIREQSSRLLPRGDGVRPLREEDVPELHRLHDALPWRVERSEAEMRALLGCPRMSVLVREKQGRIVAYACMGRGRDLKDAIHEWVGPTDDVLVLVRALAEERWREPAASTIFLMMPPEPASVRLALHRLGLASSAGYLALAKVLDRAALERLLGNRLGTLPRIALEDRELLGLLFPAFGKREAVNALESAFPDARGKLPLPLYLRGLDSI